MVADLLAKQRVIISYRRESTYSVSMARTSNIISIERAMTNLSKNRGGGDYCLPAQ